MKEPQQDFWRARWYVMRPAQNRSPRTYRCPLCAGFLPAVSAHWLLTPDGDPARRRHAHSACVEKARAAGRLPLREEVEPPGPSVLRRLLRACRPWRRSSTGVK